jgi:hypothetical protein
MASSLSTGIDPTIQQLLLSIAAIAGKDINLANSKSFRVVLECPNGQALNLRVTPLDQGVSTKAGPVASPVTTFGQTTDAQGASGVMAQGQHTGISGITAALGDVLAVREVVASAVPSGIVHHYDVSRQPTGLVAVQARTASGTIPSGVSSIVKVFNIKQP